MATAPAAVNPAVLSALTLQYGRTRADLDDQQNRRRINYNSAMDKMRRTYDDTALQSREGMAGRGMLHAGPSLAQQTKLRDTYNRSSADATQGFNLDLATNARRRLETQQEYDINKVLAGLGLPTSS